MPPPNVIRDFTELHPEAAAIIFGQFKAEGDHRREMERMEQQRLSRGQTHAALFALGMILLTAFAIYVGAYVLAGVFGSTTIVGGIIALLGTKGQRAEAPDAKSKPEGDG